VQSGRVPFGVSTSRAGAAVQGFTLPAQESLERSTFESGVEALSVDLPVATTTLSLFVKAGTRYEDRQTAGAASFLKHLAYKGSADKSALRLVRDLEHVGASMHVTVDREHIAYHITGLRPSAAHDIPLAVMAETLRAVMQPTLHEYEVASVRPIVIHDAQLRAQDGELSLRDRLHAEAFVDSGISRPSQATEGNASQRTPQQLHRFVSDRYTSGPNVRIVGTGIEHSTLTTAFSRLLGAKDSLKLRAPYFELRSLAPLPALSSSLQNAASAYPKTPVIIRNEDDGPARLILGFKGPSLSSKDLLALQLFAEVLGTGSVDVFNPGRLANRSSRLGRVLNTSYAFVDSYSDGGVFGVYAAAEDGNAGSLLSTVNKEVRAAAESLSDDDVSRARNLLQSRFSSLSSSRALYATELASRGLTVRALSDAASSLSRSDIQSAVSSALSSAPIIVARGDVTGLRL